MVKLIDLAGQAVKQDPPVEVEVLVRLGTVHLLGWRFLLKSRLTRGLHLAR